MIETGVLLVGMGWVAWRAWRRRRVLEQAAAEDALRRAARAQPRAEED